MKRKAWKYIIPPDFLVRKKGERKKIGFSFGIWKHRNLLYLCDIIRWHTLHNATPLYIRPAIPGIFINKNKPLPHSHTPLSLAPSLVVIECFDIVQFLGPALGSHGWALFFQHPVVEEVR